MTITPRKVRLVFGPLESQDPTSKALTFPTSAQIYLSDKSTVATVYSNTTGTALTNSPLPTPVATGAPGLDAYGNVVFYGDPGVDYFVLMSSLFLPVPTTGIHGTDFLEHVAVSGSVTDPHADRAYADAHKVDQTSLAVAGGVATLDSAGCIPANQWVFD